jgi:hypothetical protein
MTHVNAAGFACTSLIYFIIPVISMRVRNKKYPQKIPPQNTVINFVMLVCLFPCSQ